MTAPTVYPETIHAAGIWYPNPHIVIIYNHGNRRPEHRRRTETFYPGNAMLAERCALCPQPIRVGQLYINDRTPPVHLHCAQATQ